MSNNKSKNSGSNTLTLIGVVIFLLIFRPKVITDILFLGFLIFFGIVFFVIIQLLFSSSGGGSGEGGLTGNPHIFDDWNDWNE